MLTFIYVFLKRQVNNSFDYGKCSEENSPMLNNIINVNYQLFYLCTETQFDKSFKQVHCDEGETV